MISLSSGDNLLCFTVKHGNVEMVRHVLDRQPNARVDGENISLALACALENNREEEIVALLLKRKKLIDDNRKERERNYLMHYSVGGRYG